MVKFIINIWGIHEKNGYYTENKNHFLKSIKEQGFNTLSLWTYVNTDFIKTAKEIYGFEIHSLLPSIISGEYKLYDQSKLTDGTTMDQINLKDGVLWGNSEISKIEHDSLIDEWIVVDRPWYLMFACKQDCCLSLVHLPFNDMKSKEILHEHNIELPYIANFKDENFLYKWKNFIHPILFDLYMQRFDPILKWCIEHNKKTCLPIVRHKKIRETGAHRESFKIIENYISKYHSDIIVLNAMMDNCQWFNNMQKENNIELWGGTEDVHGLSLHKNGRKLMNWGYDGTVSNEHQVMNNRHPTWNQTKNEIHYLTIKHDDL